MEHTKESDLSVLGRLAAERGDHALAADIGEAEKAAEAGQFTLALLGQFKRGKSTLLNALLGRTVSPVDVAPLTSTIIVIQEGAPERCEIQFQDGHREAVAFDELPRYVTEEGNPGNRLGVQAAFVYLQHPLLSLGVRLVDTPGVGSVFSLNTDVTQSFLPRIDVALAVLGGEPPITGDELELVKAAAPRAGRMIFVMNKADLLDSETRQKAEAFARKVLEEALGEDPGRFLFLSARRAARGEDDAGFGELRQMLEDLAREAGEQLAALSASASKDYFAGRLLHAIALERRGLLTPIEQMDAQIQRFQRAVQDVEDLALAAQARASQANGPDPREAEWERDEFARAQSLSAMKAIEQALKEAKSRGERRRLVQPLAERLVRGSVAAWLAKASEETRGLLKDRTDRITAETRRLAERVEQAAAECFNVPLAAYGIRCPKPDFERIIFDFVRPTSALDPQDWLYPALETLLPRPLATALAMRRARHLVRDWLRYNLHAIEARRVDVLDGATRLLQQDMMKALHHLESMILETIKAGVAKRDEGERAVAARLAELDRQQSIAEGVLEAGALSAQAGSGAGPS
jgi:GTP-binding protein EngB required for normal cell division